MLKFLNKHAGNLYLLGGAACLTSAGLITFGAMFSSIRFALTYALLAAAPIFVGLLGTSLHIRIFPLLVLFGCSVTAVGILYIYGRDAIEYPSSHTSFIHEPIGWIYLILHFAQAMLAVREMKPRPLQDGD